MAPLTTHSARDRAPCASRLNSRVAHIALAVTIEVVLALLHLPSEVHAGLAIVLHLVAEMLR